MIWLYLVGYVVLLGHIWRFDPAIAVVMGFALIGVPALLALAH